MKCIVCFNPIPPKRFDESHPNVRYCSSVCIKRAYYLKKHAGVSILRDRDKIAWLTTETGKGYKWERYVADGLGATLNNTVKDGFGKHADLTWGDKLVEVKSANLYKRTNKRGVEVNKNTQTGWWRFDRGSMQNPDYFFCVGLINDIPIKMYLIPDNEFGKRGITLSPVKSKYDKFLYVFK